MRKKLISKVGEALVVINAGAAFVTPVDAAVPKSDQLVLEEIVVTAQKRTERLLDVPIAISAISAREMEDFRMVDTNSFANQVPNLHIKNGVGSDVTVAIRGVSSNNTGNIGFESAVGWYMDGIYFGKGLGTLFDLGDVERLEVLRGPQGTLYGRNTIGGAINLISTRPTGELGGNVKIGLGNENLVETKLAVNTGTLGSEEQGLGTLKARLSYFTRDREGFTGNVDQGLSVSTDQPISDEVDAFGEIDHKGAHVALDWDIRSNLRVTYDYLWSDVDDTARLFQLIDIVPAFNPPGFDGFIVDGFPDNGSTDLPIHSLAESDSHSVIVTWDINENLTLKSLSSVRHIETEELLDLDGSSTDWYISDNVFDHDQFSQEFQLLVNLDRVKIVGGLYYFEEEVELLRMRSFVNRLFISRVNSRADNDNFAVFGQVDWNITDAWSVAFGARYTEETKQMDRYIENLPSSGVPIVAVPADYNDPAFGLRLPEIELEDTSIMVSTAYNFNENINVYGKYSEGFRSGGYDGAVSNPAAAPIPFDSEKLESIEIGVKAELFDNRLRLNAASFYDQYDDIQLGRFDGMVAITDNAGKVTFSGFELEAEAVISERLSGSFNYAYLDYDIEEYDLGVGIGDASTTAEINNAPPTSYSVSLNYRLAEISGAPVDAFINYVYSDGAHAIAVNTDGSPPNSKTDDYRLINARLSLTELALGSDMSVTVALWGNNLADEEYFDNIIDWGAFRSGTIGWPRTYGLEATLNF